MRAIAVVAVLMVMVTGGRAFGDELMDGEANVDPQVVEVYHSAGDEFGMGLAATILSVLYTPVRLVYGVAGAGIGGVEGWLTGGNLRTARGTWRVTTEGDYYIRPDHFDGTERFEFTNIEPVVHDRYVRPRPAAPTAETAADTSSEM